MAQHPLEPLSADEFRRTTEILRREGHVTETFRFASIELMEPAKQEVLAWRAGDALPGTRSRWCGTAPTTRPTKRRST